MNMIESNGLGWRKATADVRWPNGKHDETCVECLRVRCAETSRTHISDRATCYNLASALGTITRDLGMSNGSQEYSRVVAHEKRRLDETRVPLAAGCAFASLRRDPESRRVFPSVPYCRVRRHPNQRVQGMTRCRHLYASAKRLIACPSFLYTTEADAGETGCLGWGKGATRA
jgi:hypothetical protein